VFFNLADAQMKLAVYRRYVAPAPTGRGCHAWSPVVARGLRRAESGQPPAIVVMPVSKERTRRQQIPQSYSQSP